MVLSASVCWICGSDVVESASYCSRCGTLLGPSRQTVAERVLGRPNDFLAVGIFMLVAGAVLGIFSFLANITPLLALALGTLFLGVMVLFLPESASLRLERVAVLSSLSSMMSIEALLEDLDISSRGIYLPVKGFAAVPKVMMPMTESVTVLDSINRFSGTNRVFITLGLNPKDRGVLIYPPGGEILIALENALRLDLSTIKLYELETRLKSGLDMLGIAGKTLVRIQSEGVEVETELTSMRQLEERLRVSAPRLSEQVGTPVASAVVSAIAKVTGKPLKFGSSRVSGTKLVVNVPLSEVELR